MPIVKRIRAWLALKECCTTFLHQVAMMHWHPNYTFHMTIIWSFADSIDMPMRLGRCARACTLLRVARLRENAMMKAQ